MNFAPSPLPETEPPHDCPNCPRLVAFRNELRAEFPTWWNAPVPAFGDPDAWLGIIGLAPGKHGANRTGRPFTGDFAGQLLYETLGKFGLAEGVFADTADKGVVFADRFDRGGIAASFALIEHRNAGRFTQDIAGFVGRNRLFEFEVDGFRVAHKDRHAHGGAGDLDLWIEDLLGFGQHLPLFLGVAVFHEHIDVRDDVEGDLLGELLGSR